MIIKKVKVKTSSKYVRYVYESVYGIGSLITCVIMSYILKMKCHVEAVCLSNFSLMIEIKTNRKNAHVPYHISELSHH
jgi:cellobiose-specific phosphotransferase system component IIC